MTNSYSNAVSGAAATSAPFFSSQDSTAHAQSAASSANSSVPRAPIAPWVESAFVAIPAEFFRVAICQLSKRAQSLYFLHCSHARTRGENAGLSYCYRETLANKLNCSLDTIDRANAELEKYGLIEDAGRRYQHGGAVVYRINSPAKWKFEAPKSPKRATRKTAALAPQSCGGGAATVRPITRDVKQLKTKEQQTAPIEKPKSGANEAGVVVASNQDSVEKTETPNTEELRVITALEQQGFKAAMAQRLVAQYGVEACAYQLQRLDGQSAVRSRTGWLIAALERGDRDEEPSVAAPLALTDEERAQRVERAEARERKESEVAARVWAGLEMKRQAYIGRCVELEGASLVEVIKREEHGAFAAACKE